MRVQFKKHFASVSISGLFLLFLMGTPAPLVEDIEEAKGCVQGEWISSVPKQRLVFNADGTYEFSTANEAGVAWAEPKQGTWEAVTGENPDGNGTWLGFRLKGEGPSDLRLKDRECFDLIEVVATQTRRSFDKGGKDPFGKE